MVNRYTNLSTSEFNPISFEQLAAVPLQRRKEHDLAQSQADELAAIDINRLPVDDIRVRGIIENYQNKLNEYTDQLSKEGINKSNINKIRDLNKEKRSLMSPTGLLGAAQGNYESVQAYRKELKDEKIRQGWDLEQANSFANNQVQNFVQKGGTFGEHGLNSFNGEYLPEYVDRNNWINDRLKNIDYDSIGVNLSKYGNLDSITTAFKHGKIDTKDYNKIMKSLVVQAQNDPKLLRSLQQEGNFTGEGSPTDLGQFDAKGNYMPGQSSFANQLAGAGLGNQFRRENFKYIKDNDELSLMMAKKKLEEESTNPDYETLPAKKFDIFNKSAVSVANNILEGKKKSTNQGFNLGSNGILGVPILSRTSINNHYTIEDIPYTIEDIKSKTGIGENYDVIISSLIKQGKLPENIDYASKEAVSGFKNYVEATQSLSIQNNLMKDGVSKRYASNTIGNIKKNTEEIARDILQNAESRKFYLEEEGKLLSYDEMLDEGYLEEDISERLKQGAIVNGTFDSYNFLKLGTQDPDASLSLTAPMSMKVGKKTFLVTPPASIMDSPAYKADTDFNNIYQELTTKPNIPLSYEDPRGSSIKLVYNPLEYQGKFLPNANTDGDYVISVLDENGEVVGSKRGTKEAVRNYILKSKGINLE